MKTVALLTLATISSLSHAATTYICQVSAQNPIGIGLETEITLLADGKTANVTPYMTGLDGGKFMQVSIKNPGALTKNGDVLHIENEVTAPTGLTGIMQVNIDLKTLQMSFPKSPETTIPCTVK